MRRALLLAALAAGLLGALPGEAAAQCAMCATSLTNSEEGRALGPHFNRAILVMLAAPYLVAAAVAGTVFRHRLARWFRRAAASRRPFGIH